MFLMIFFAFLPYLKKSPFVILLALEIKYARISVEFLNVFAKMGTPAKTIVQVLKMTYHQRSIKKKILLFMCSLSCSPLRGFFLTEKDSKIRLFDFMMAREITLKTYLMYSKSELDKTVSLSICGLSPAQSKMDRKGPPL